MENKRVIAPANLIEENIEEINTCKRLLYEDSKLRFFFEISLPAAIKKRKTIGHILFICPDEDVKKNFITLLKFMLKGTEFKETSFQSGLSPGDLSAILTNLTEGAFLLVDNNKLIIDSDCIDVFENAISDYHMDITIGKGPSARFIRLDLPRFTTVVCIATLSNSVMSLVNNFEYIIKIDENKLSRICKAKIKALCPLDILDDACDYISYKAKNDVSTSVNYLKRILEYIDFYGISTTITVEMIKEVFNISGIGDNLELEEPFDDEIVLLFKEIRNSLKDIHEDLHSLRGNVEEFIELNS